MFIDFMTPFSDAGAMLVVQELTKSALLFAPQPGYLQEMKRTVLPVAPTCEGFHCYRCASPILRTDSPQSFYNEPTECCEDDAMEDAVEEAMAAAAVYDDEDEDEFNDYIDYVLDFDYDY